MNFESIVFQLSVIVVGAAALGTIFLYLRQPIMVAYIAVGILFGPHGFQVVQSTDIVEEVAHIGVMLLLFLVGLNLNPQNLLHLFRKTVFMTLATCLSFAAISAGFALAIGFGLMPSLLFGAAMMFSSTVVGLKLVPTTALHHRRTGEVMTGVLLLQDLLAILVILFLAGPSGGGDMAVSFLMVIVKLAGICIASFVGVKYHVVPLLRKFDVVQEYTFVAVLGWCLLWAEVAHIIGMSYETGAFIAGLSIASCKAANVIAEHLKPLREFFLILFFFAVGAKLNFMLNPTLVVMAVIFGVALVFIKSRVFEVALRRSGETPELARELGVRLGQSSEFSLLVVMAATASGVLTDTQAMVIQVTTISTFVVSTYWTVAKYPTPISMKAGMRKD